MYFFKHCSKEYKLIAKSKLFDKKWYLRTYTDVAMAKKDPVSHYIKYGWREGRNPSSFFDTNEYLDTNPDVAAADMNPLYHYLKFGCYENRMPELSKIKKVKTKFKKVKAQKVKFPKGAVSQKYVSKDFVLKDMHRVAIFASYSGNGEIADYVVYYLRELKKVCDAIIFIADNPIFPGEIEKIKDLVIFAKFKRHCEYDFGSYKRGYNYAKKIGVLDKCDEIVICNDSCYGPVYPFEEVFGKMDKQKDVDFWGLVANDDIKFHLQSYFLVFKKQVFNSKPFDKFINSVKKEKSFWDIVLKYEIEMTDFLKKNNFKVSAFFPDVESLSDLDTFTDKNMLSLNFRAGSRNPTVFPLSMIEKYRFPLIKVKALTNGFLYALEEKEKAVLEFVKKENLELYDAIVSNLKTKKYYDVICDNDIIKLIENSKVVSFDVFDTLLIRPYVAPTDLFKHMELHYDADGFYDARIKAESVARKLNKEKEDVTLDEIYNCISPEFKYLKNKELLFEKQMLMKHPKNYDIYRAAVNMNKKIIVTSDMYLPSDFLKDVLKKNGYDHIDAVYVSGEYNKAKWSGNLFKQVIKDLKINPEEVLHIGDNKQADIEMPKSLGINTYYVEKYIDRFNLYFGNAKFSNFYAKNRNLQASVLTSLIAIAEMKNNLSYWQWVGYTLAGPLGLGYVQFMCKKLAKTDVDTLLFVARDGCLLQKIYNLVEKQPLENHYVYAPRVLNLKCFGDYFDIPVYFDALVSILSEKFKGILDCKNVKEKKEFLNKHSKEVQKYFDGNLKEYTKYLNSLNIKGTHIASVDMTTGAFTSERFLQKLFKDKYEFGFFSGTYFEKNDLRYLTYMKSVINPKKYEGIVKLTELLITSPELPIRDIKDEKPVYKETNDADEQRIKIFKDIEIGALNFVKDYKELFGEQMIEFDDEVVFSLLDSYVRSLSHVDISHLKEIKHPEDVCAKKYTSLYDEIKKCL